MAKNSFEVEVTFKRLTEYAKLKDWILVLLWNLYAYFVIFMYIIVIC